MMFEKNKGRYLTRGVSAEIPPELQLFMWQAIDQMPEPKDYLQVFRLSVKNGLQVIHHTSEQPEFNMTYILTTVATVATVQLSLRLITLPKIIIPHILIIIISNNINKKKKVFPLFLKNNSSQYNSK